MLIDLIKSEYKKMKKNNVLSVLLSAGVMTFSSLVAVTGYAGTPIPPDPTLPEWVVSNADTKDGELVKKPNLSNSFTTTSEFPALPANFVEVLQCGLTKQSVVTEINFITSGMFVAEQGHPYADFEECKEALEQDIVGDKLADCGDGVQDAVVDVIVSRCEALSY